MPKPRSFFFDISTTAVWRGHSVGIVRVEQELARRVHKNLGAEAGYSVYDKAAGTFRSVKDEYVAQFLAGTARLPGGRPRLLGRVLTPDLWHRLRDLTLFRLPRLYRFIQRVRGFDLSGTDVVRIRSEIEEERRSGQAAKTVSARSALGPAIMLDGSVTIISGGLDWDHKDIRQIHKLREESGFKYISLVYDLIPVKTPHYVKPQYSTALAEFFGELVRTADGCLCISETTRRDLLSYCEEKAVPPPPARGFPLGSELAVLAGTRADLPDGLAGMNVVLFVSTIEPRKNHRTAYEAWCHGIIAGTIDPGTDRLVFVGRRGWSSGDLLEEIEANPLTRETVIVLSDVSDASLQSLYQAAAFVIFPSFYEGFGLPLAEALAYGKVCVTSGAGALSEIGGRLRIDIDPRDTIEWAATIGGLLRDPAKRAGMEAAIRQTYRATSWDQSAAAFFAAVRNLTQA